MPNGGSSNCRSCKFNKVNEEGSSIQNYPEAATPAFCVIRETTIVNPLWTYCINYHTASEIPDGPIYSAGIDDMNRIPWYGKNRPELGSKGLCQLCKNEFENGIEIGAIELRPRQL